MYTASNLNVENCHYTETFDVDDVEVESRPGGTLCFTVKYVPGGNKRCFIMCTTKSEQYLRSETINGTNKCIHGIPAHSGYVIIATDSDLDAINKIDVIAPFTTTVVIPSYTLTTHASQRITQTGYCKNNKIIITTTMPVLTSFCFCFSIGYT